MTAWALAAVVVIYLYLDGKRFIIDLISLGFALILFLWIALVAVTLMPVALAGTIIIGSVARLVFQADTMNWGRNVVAFITKWMFFGARK